MRAEATGKTTSDRPRESPDTHAASEVYARRFSGATGEYLLQVQTRAILRLLAPWPQARVLDIGGGHAQVAVPVPETGRHVTVLASEPAAFGRARRLAGERVVLATGDLCAPPFPERNFDVVIALRLMPHVADWRALVAGLCRTARHAVIVDFPIPGGSNALEPLFFGVKKQFEGDTRRFAVISKEEVRRAFADHGFRVDTEIGQFVLPMALHRALGTPSLSRAAEGVLARLGLARRIGTPVIIRAVREPDE